MTDPSQISVPRLARLVKGNQGYGFNLHGDKNQPGQTISAVDKDSPAEQGGLREGDKLIEVNGCNVEGMSHGEVVKKIKENQNETSLLVCDKVTLAYLAENNRPCTADMVNLSTVYVKPEAEPAPVLANGDATPEVVSEKIEESAPVAVEESAPPPAPEPAPSAPEEHSGPTPDEAEAVKELKRVVDEHEDKPAEVPVVESEPPKPEEPPKAEPPSVAVAQHVEPVKAEPAKSTSDSDFVLDMKSARPSVNKRKSAKQSGQDWSNKVSVINSL
ncbi:Na(+)/H(+) exchange regulatory cofactor NHE-RF1-like [Actinia tenebrosa]|uniref:Na(+)/H(+) exchange regulatory cofactor NHE-RF1-like n=1 Tax=Actinia tenebrosa TaxID=6105 RepID=A0A6P8IG82_ACTTE|nr:Na(+)/H(+) exchange regulatory cofactor NHE-RF1-like [Actinia tenebrosa]